MSDLIERQAAITIPVTPKEDREYQTYNLDDVYEQAWEDLQKHIGQLPSVQPDHTDEIIACADCNIGYATTGDADTGITVLSRQSGAVTQKRGQAMSKIDWMEEEAYAIADRMEESLNKAYKQGVNDAWSNAKTLWNNGTCSFEWSAEEMMLYAEKGEKCRNDVERIANEIGIHALYSMVRDMRGEQE